MLSSQSKWGPDLPNAVALLRLSAWHCFSCVWGLSTPMFSLTPIPGGSPLPLLPRSAGGGVGECLLAR